METISHCEYCQQQMPCRNLYVAMKILEEELRWAQRPDLEQAFHTLQNDMNKAGYAYPSSGNFCSLAEHKSDTQVFLQRSELLLKELRRTIKLAGS